MRTMIKEHVNKTILIYCFIAAILSGVITALVLLPIRAPQELGESYLKTVPITYTEGNDSRSVNVLITGGGGHHVQTGVSGVVTALDIETGSIIKSGDAPIEVNGQRITFTHTPTPPFQNVEHLIWISSDEVKISNLSIALGDSVQIGQEILTIPNSIKSATIDNFPKDLIAGERVLNFGNITIPVDENGNISNDDLSKIASSSNYTQSSSQGGSQGALQSSSTSSSSQSAGNSGGQGTAIPARLQLKTPVNVAVVAPGSIITNPNGNACLVENGNVYKIEITGSELGRSFVKFQTDTPPQNVDFKPDESTKCE